MEALQCIKCVIQQDLLFRELTPSSKLEKEESNQEPEDAEVAETKGDLGDPEESDFGDFLEDGLVLTDKDDDE